MTDKTICYCLGVSESRIVQAVREGAHSLKAIQQATKACTGNRCRELNPQGRCCADDIIAIIARETATDPPADSCC